MNNISAGIIRMSFLLIMGVSGLVYGQEHTVNATVKALPDQMVYLARYSDDELIISDSLMAMNGEVHFLMDSLEKPGTRWLFFGAPGPGPKMRQPGFIEFIYDREDVNMYAKFPELNSSVDFVNPEINSLYREFQANEEEYTQKLSLMVSVLDKYPSEDDYYTSTIAYYEAIQQARDLHLQAYERSYPGSYIARLAASARQPVIPGKLDSEGRVSFLKKHYFDAASINDPALLASPVYNHKIIEYLSLYKVRTGTADQEKAFRDAVDVIMANTSDDPELRSFVVDYLLKGFESFQMEEIQTYIIDNYVDENCKTDLVDMAIERIDAYRKMAVGQTAPDIVIRDSHNKTVRLSDSKHKYTAVIFWASYCEHCQKLMPKLSEWYKQERAVDLDFLAISIDTVKNDWVTYLAGHDLPWTNALELLGWNGKAPGDYNVYATPTIFILDNKRTIIAKPYTYRDFVREVNKLN